MRTNRHRAQHVASPRRRAVVARLAPLARLARAALLALAVLVILLTGCSGSTAKATPTSTPFLSAGQVAIILSTRSEESKPSPSGTPGVPPTPQAPKGKLSALRASDGTVMWSMSTDGTIASVVSTNGTVYAGVVATTASAPIQTTLLALHVADGSQVWTHHAETTELPLAAGTGALYIASVDPGTQQIRVQALQASDGHALWTVPLQGTPVSAFGGSGVGAVLESGTLYFSLLTKQPTGSQVQIAALRTSDGKTLWTTPPVGQFFAPGQLFSPVVSNGTVYAESLEIGDPTGRTPPTPTTSIIAWRASDGTQLWKHVLGAGVVPSGPGGLTASAHAVYTATTVASPGPSGPPSGAIIALDPASGMQQWRADASGVVQGLFATESAVYAAALSFNPLIPSSPPTATMSAYGPSDGKQIWTHPVLNGILQGHFEATSSSIYLPVISKGGGPEPAGVFDALSATDGSVQWTSPIDGYLSTWLAAVA